MTHNKALTSFFQAKHVPPAFLNLCDQTIQPNFVLGQVLGVDNPAAYYLSRPKTPFKDKIHLKLANSIPVFRIETDIAPKMHQQDEDETDYYPYVEADENIR